MKVSLLFLLATIYALPVAGRCSDGVELIWPLSRSGDNLILKLPPRYAGRELDGRGTGEMHVADMTVEDDLMITALWPELNPPADYDSSFWPHGTTMQALIQPRALGGYRGYSINKLESDFDNTIDMGRRAAYAADVLAKSGPVTRDLCQKAKELDSKPEKFGLQRMGIDFKKIFRLSREQSRRNPATGHLLLA